MHLYHTIESISLNIDDCITVIISLYDYSVYIIVTNNCVL